ncbi:metallophosphoesterase [Paenibacillus thermotolerans]|uniref:metallophosphoesterase n=1 Tax=Paenibacillus thermotolerans TaxID=3027807 RepID=UPI002367BBBA|nr:MULTISPECIES: metallophosphoesterase [unclassified Paenibacillus]
MKSFTPTKWRSRLTAVALTSALLMPGWAGQALAQAETGQEALISQLNAADSTVTSSVYAPLSLSVRDLDVLSGIETLQAETGNPDESLSLYIDDVQMPAVQGLPKPPEFVMEVNGFDNGFKNGILIGDQVVHIFEGAVTGYQTVRVPIPTNFLQKGANVISLYSGNNQAPTGTEGNNDDFTVRNFRLILSDGTVMPVEDIKVRIGDGSIQTVPATDPVALRDGLPPNDLTARESADFLFTIPDEKFLAWSYEWDTTQSADGVHTVTAKAAGPNGEQTVEAKTIVDNSKPVIESTSIVEGKTYKGNIEFSVKAVDTVSGIAKVEGKLDGNPIRLPSTVAGVDLAPGAHRFEVTATDKAGNQQSASVSFNVVEEHPYKPAETDPADGAQVASLNPKLNVRVNDPTGDPMDVTFYQGFRADLNNKTVNKAYSNATDREPPLEMIPSGETEFSAEAYSAAAVADDSYFTTDADTKFPYHRFDLTLQNNLAGIKEVEVVWEGHSLPGRQVTLYTWNYNTGKWEAAASGMGELDFTLRAMVSVKDMVQNNVIRVLVQDLIPSPDEYDFTFAWITDTQYYSESYPDIFDKMNRYIVDNRKELKIDYTVHTGDIVDDWNQPNQWANANKSMKILDDANMPYGVVAGNHDVNFNAANYAEYWKYFGKDRFEDRPYYGGQLGNNRDHYDLISSEGNDFIILYLGWSITQETIDWANEALKQYPDRNAIVATHEYISPSGDYTGQGQEIWEKIVAKNDNVFLVLCGHHHGVAYNVKHVGDRTVIEMLSDYQAGPEGGSGYLRLLHFDAENGQLIVNTYSPYKDDYNFFADEKEEFSLPIELKPVEKQVATDYIAVNAYTDNVIGKASDIPSGGKATVGWRGLKKGSTYYWYVRLSDDYGGRTTSDVWGFTVR